MPSFKSRISLDAGLSLGVIQVNTDHTISTGECVIDVDASSGPIILTLPTVAGNNGKLYIIKKVDATANTVTINPSSGAELIDGDANVILTVQWECSEIIADTNITGWISVSTGGGGGDVYTYSGNNFSGLNTFYASGTSAVPITAVGYASQTVNLTEWKDDTLTTNASIAPDGTLNAFQTVIGQLGDGLITTGSVFASIIINGSADSSIGYSGTTDQTNIELGAGSFENATGNGHAVDIVPTYNQTGAAGGTDLFINRTETAVGSGPHNLIDAEVNSVSRFKVSNSGGITSALSASGTVGLSIQGYSGHYVNLIETKDVSSVLKQSVSSDGYLTIGDLTPNNSVPILVNLSAGFTPANDAIKITNNADVKQMSIRGDGNVDAPNVTYDRGGTFYEGGSTITSGFKPAAVTITTASTIEAWFLTVNDGLDMYGAPTAKSFVVDVYKRIGGGTPTLISDVELPTTNSPTLSSQTYATDSALTGWSKTLAAGDSLVFNVVSGDATSVTLTLRIKRL